MMKIEDIFYSFKEFQKDSLSGLAHCSINFWSELYFYQLQHQYFIVKIMLLYFIKIVKIKHAMTILA